MLLCAHCPLLLQGDAFPNIAKDPALVRRGEGRDGNKNRVHRGREEFTVAQFACMSLRCAHFDYAILRSNGAVCELLDHTNCQNVQNIHTT